MARLEESEKNSKQAIESLQSQIKEMRQKTALIDDERLELNAQNANLKAQLMEYKSMQNASEKIITIDSNAKLIGKHMKELENQLVISCVYK